MNLALPLQHYPTHRERAADAWVHGVGLTLAALGGLVLLVWSILDGAPGEIGAVAIYALCWLAMLTASAFYNFHENSTRQPLLRRLDHAAIFLMIAGTYTPFTTQRFEGAWALGMTAAVWALALAGVAGKLFLPGLSKRIWLVLYLGLGWLALIALDPFIRGVSPIALGLIVAGGIIYSVGVIFYMIKNLPYRRAIWHGAVVSASGTHYAAVLVGVLLPAPLA